MMSDFEAKYHSNYDQENAFCKKFAFQHCHTSQLHSKQVEYPQKT